MSTQQTPVQQTLQPGQLGQPGQPGTTRRLTRGDGWLGGVCAGVADYLGLDVTLVRLLTVLGTIFGLGSLVLVYLVAWILVPRAAEA